MKISASFVQRRYCSLCKMIAVGLIFLVTSVLQLVQCDEIVSCFQVDSCTCKFSDGSVISLTTLANPSKDGPRFNFTQATDSYFYAYNPCSSFSWQQTACQNVAACQMSQSGKDVYDIGDQSTAKFNGAGSAITYTSTVASTTRTSTVNLKCDRTATDPVLTTKGEFPSKSSHYIFELTSNCACPNGCIGGGLSPGSILCILFSVLVIIYIVVGILFLKFVRGAEGKELVPNYEFWADLPMLIKDGVLFLASGCKSEPNNYEQI